MTGKTHIVCGLSGALAIGAATTGTLYLTRLSSTNYILPVTVLTSVIGSLLIDVDIENSRMSNKIAQIQKWIRAICISLGVITALAAVFNFLVQKRGFQYETMKLFVLSFTVIAILWVISINPHKYLKHRGATHAPVLTLIVYSLASNMPWFISSLLMGVALGMGIHLIADLFNGKGIPLFWPISNKHVHVAKIKTRTGLEFIFMIVWVVLCLFVTYTSTSAGVVDWFIDFKNLTS